MFNNNVLRVYVKIHVKQFYVPLEKHALMENASQQNVEGLIVLVELLVKMGNVFLIFMYALRMRNMKLKFVLILDLPKRPALQSIISELQTHYSVV